MSYHRVFSLVLHKSEWERLKIQSGQLQPTTEEVNGRQEYIEALNERSQKWINAWPDSAEEHKEKLKMKKKNQRKEDIAMIDAFRQSRRHEDNQDAVRRAKQLIFDDSCYGRQLISAVRESKTLEEREAQIKFKKEIQQKETEMKQFEEIATTLFIPSNDEEVDRKKLAAVECVKFNKELELKKEKAGKLKMEQNECEIVDPDMIKKYQDAEANKKVELKRLDKEEIEKYEAIQKQVHKHRKIQEKRDNALIEIYKKEQERIKCKVNAVLAKNVDENRNEGRPLKIYEMIDKIQNAEKRRYDDFIQKGIEDYNERNAMQEKEDMEIQNRNRAKLRQISQENQISGENRKLYLKQTAPVNKCVCDTQKILIKSEKKPLNKGDEKVDEGEIKKVFKDVEDSKKEYIFLKPRCDLVQDLRRREKASSHWMSAGAAHDYFAQQAASAIHDSKYKHFAKKVVGKYLKLNNLDSSALQIKNIN